MLRADQNQPSDPCRPRKARPDRDSRAHAGAADERALEAEMIQQRHHVVGIRLPCVAVRFAADGAPEAAHVRENDSGAIGQLRG
jgi:hypothetical protein